MGKVYSHIAWRISRNLNPEARALKLISQDKVRPPPKLKSTEEYLETLRKEQPGFGEELQKKDADLLKRLEQVYVKSKDPALEEHAAGGRRADLPVDRTPNTLAEFGYSEPSRVPYGRVTLRGALGFLTLHSEDPAKHTAESIAIKYKLDEKVVADILRHYKLMVLHEPEVTGRVPQLDWRMSDREPASERAFRDEEGRFKLPESAEEMYAGYSKEKKPPVEASKPSLESSKSPSESPKPPSESSKPPEPSKPAS